LQYERCPIPNAEDEYKQSTASEGICMDTSDDIDYKWFIVALAIINGAALLLANFQAYQARFIPTKFSESGFIGLSMGIMLQGFLMALPAFFMHSSITTFYSIISSLVLLTSGSVLYLIFVPKILAWWANKRVTMTTADPSSGSGLRMEWHQMIALKACLPSDQQQRLRVVKSSSVIVIPEEGKVECDSGENDTKAVPIQEPDEKHTTAQHSSDSPGEPEIEREAESDKQDQKDVPLGLVAAIEAVQSDCNEVHERDL